MKSIKTGNFIACSDHGLIGVIADMQPWIVVARLAEFIESLITDLNSTEYIINGKQAIHKSAVIEPSAQLKGPIIIGPNCFVANGSLLRGGVILDSDCIVGHGCELKTSMMFAGSKIAHLSFVGDSLLGYGVNIEAGAILANYRNELEDKEIRVLFENQYIATGVEKFGAIVGDNTKIGANAVIAPGSLMFANCIVVRGSLFDQSNELG